MDRQNPFGIRTVVGKRYRYIRNFFPENEFSIPVSRMVFEKSRDLVPLTRERTERYMKRPAEEYYDVQADSYCQHNLVEQPELGEQK